MRYRCSTCNRVYPIREGRYLCDCGGLLRIEYEKEALDFTHLVHTREQSLWRYAKALPPISAETIRQTSMGEGGTPLIQLERHLWGKADYIMPTLSFKDRGAAVLVAVMRDLGVKQCIVDSSGNAGIALAAYCARTGIACEVFVPSTTSTQKKSLRLRRIKLWCIASKAGGKLPLKLPSIGSDVLTPFMPVMSTTHYFGRGLKPTSMKFLNNVTKSYPNY